MVGTARQGGVRPASASSIEIDFYYRGARCRERLKLIPTPRNLRYATNLLGQILMEIEKGMFDYHTHFPNSARAKSLSAQPGALVTIEKRLLAWYAQKEQELEHSTLIGYRRIINNVLIPHSGKILLRDYSLADGKDLVVRLGQVTPKRINNVLGPLRGMLDEAVDEEIIKSNPLNRLKVRRRGRIAVGVVDKVLDKIDPFTPEEVASIMVTAASEPQFRNYCQFNLGTGMRTSEVIGLTWPDVDLAGKTARIRQAWVMGAMKAPKTTAGARMVPLLPMAVEALRAQQAHTRFLGGAVFRNPRTGEPWASDKQVRESFWRQLLKRAGVRYRYPYQMRHTFASTALSAGENVMWVSQMIGHKDWTVTAKTYARWIPSVVPDAGDKVSAAWQPVNG